MDRNITVVAPAKIRIYFKGIFRGRVHLVISVCDSNTHSIFDLENGLAPKETLILDFAGLVHDGQLTGECFFAEEDNG